MHPIICQVLKIKHADSRTTKQMKMHLWAKHAEPVLAYKDENLSTEDCLDYAVSGAITQKDLKLLFTTAKHSNPKFVSKLKGELKEEMHQLSRRQDAWNSFDDLYFQNLEDVLNLLEE